MASLAIPMCWHVVVMDVI